MKEKIEIAAKIIPIGSLLLILASSIKLTTFYDYFNINITEYLSLQEYAALFIDDILILIYPFIFMVFGYLLSMSMNKRKKDKKEAISKRVIKIVRIIMIGLLFTTIISSAIFYYCEVKTPFELLRSLKLQLNSILVLFLISILNSDKLIQNLYIFFAIFFCIPITLDGRIDAYRVLENKDELNFEFSFENEEPIITNDYMHKVGITENYIFLYNISTNEPTIIPKDKLKKVRVIKKNGS